MDHPRAWTSAGPALPQNRFALAVLVALVSVAVLVTGSRAWALTHQEWRPASAKPSAVSSLSRANAEQATTRFQGSCAGPSVPMTDWRLGAPLELRVNPDKRARQPVSAPRVAAALRRAIAAFGQDIGPCGRGPLTAWASPGGKTDVAASVHAGQTAVICGNPDGQSVVDWGRLPGPGLAHTCVFAEPDNQGTPRVVEADIRLDRSEEWVTGLHGCAAAYDLQSVLTHELGHVVGLWHPHTSTGLSSSTMSRVTPPCDLSGRTLTGPDLDALTRILD